MYWTKARVSSTEKIIVLKSILAFASSFALMEINNWIICKVSIQGYLNSDCLYFIKLLKRRRWDEAVENGRRGGILLSHVKIKLFEERHSLGMAHMSERRRNNVTSLGCLSHLSFNQTLLLVSYLIWRLSSPSGRIKSDMKTKVLIGAFPSSTHIKTP